jgi:protein-tyrosine phosphatase
MLHYQEIIPNLYLGDSGFIFETNLQHFELIVNLCPEINSNYSNISYHEIQYIKILDREEDNTKLIHLLEKDNILQKIHKYLCNKKNVMIHCAMGTSRSPSLVACYLIRFLNYNINDSIKLIKQKRKQAFQTGFTFLETIKYSSNYII